MPLTLAESQALSELAKHLYSYLPGTPAPYADPTISFRGVAKKLGLERLWPGGSKLPALNRLLSSVFEFQRGHFCPFIVEVVRTALPYRQSKAPVTREEIQALNALIIKVGFKIPERTLMEAPEGTYIFGHEQEG